MLTDDLKTLLQPTVEGLGYELYDIEMIAGKGDATLRLFIDQPDGIDIEDCERVSRQVSALLDVEDPIASDYTLEVSSPGLDRRLRTEEHFARFVGHDIKVKLRRANGGKRRFKGQLVQADGDLIVVTVGKENLECQVANIDMARLIPVADFSGLKSRGTKL